MHNLFVIFSVGVSLCFSILEVVCLDVEQEVSSGSTGRGWWCSTSRASGVEYPIFSELNLR